MCTHMCTYDKGTERESRLRNKVKSLLKLQFSSHKNSKEKLGKFRVV